LLSNALITGNSAAASGGGFSATFVQATGSTITDNNTPGFGGGFAAPAQREVGISGRISGNVQLIGCVISGNTAATTGGGFFAGHESTLTSTIVNDNMGGGIHSVHGAKLNSSTVANNSTTGVGGGILTTGTYTVFGTRYYRLGPVEINSSTITGNKASTGAGVYARGDVSARYSTISDNEATGSGGGIFVKTTIQKNRHSMLLGIHGSVGVIYSTISGNESGGAGGGINARNVTLETSTVSGNTAATGGGIYTHKVAEIRSSTITGNRALSGSGGGIWNGDDEMPFSPYTGPIHLDFSIVAGNIAAGGSPDIRPGTGQLDVGTSLIGDNAGTPLVESQTQSVTGNLRRNHRPASCTLGRQRWAHQNSPASRWQSGDRCDYRSSDSAAHRTLCRARLSPGWHAC
jgi:predicted outer membrane repeat protein